MIEYIINSLLLILFKPLMTKVLLLISNVSIVSAFIGAFGSIFGGIIGGIVAFKIAKYQIEDLKNENITKEYHTHQRYEVLLKNEIDTNQLFLKEISLTSDSNTISSIIKYSISDQMFINLKTNLKIDKFFELLTRYYRVLFRIQNDPQLLDQENLDDLIKEINYLNEIQNEIASYLSNK
ncbi:hypothetical protein ACIQYS_09505 [Psychrobacillus sp. NPDC096426]|uniref:hypothetical protein n=1 Tax=Psychrobacillus sp. NPDC096426 TaxID=3364491 RepID=UPI00381BACD3